MARHWNIFEHPSDLGLAASADTLAELFEALGEGVGANICAPELVQKRQRRTVQVAADSLENLAVDFLSELLHLFQLERFLIGQVVVDRIDEKSITATAIGEVLDPVRHPLEPEIKAVTYHQLKVAREGDKWMARVILDL